MKYNADFFIEGFEGIPDEFWCTRVFNNGKGQFCAGGHVGRDVGEHPKIYDELCRLFNRAGIRSVTEINDGSPLIEYKQKTPKARVLAALHDIKKKGL